MNTKVRDNEIRLSRPRRPCANYHVQFAQLRNLHGRQVVLDTSTRLVRIRYSRYIVAFTKILYQPDILRAGQQFSRQDISKLTSGGDLGSKHRLLKNTNEVIVTPPLGRASVSGQAGSAYGYSQSLRYH